MKIFELLGDDIADNRFMTRSMRDNKDKTALRMTVEVQQVGAMIRIIKEKLKLLDNQVWYFSPQNATTFPGDFRLTLKKDVAEYDNTQLAGKTIVPLFKSAVKFAVKEVLDVEAVVVLDDDKYANGLRYIDVKVGFR